MKLEAVYEEFHERLSPAGTVVIAGGAVRDSLRGREPKDYDIFVLHHGKFDEAKAIIEPTLADLSKVKPVVEWHLSEPYLVSSVSWNGVEVQVLANPQPDMAALVGTFDWNVCLFGYDGTYFTGEQLDNIAPGKDLKLQTVTFAASTLRRGYRFSERFKMRLPRETVVDLCRKIVENADAKRDIGAGRANEPDMPSLTANTLPR